MKTLWKFTTCALLFAGSAFAQDSTVADRNAKDGFDALASGDCTTAVEKLKNATDANSPIAQVLLGNMYSQGQCVRQDQAEALRLMILAAKPENEKVLSSFIINLATVEQDVGRRYDQGVGTQKDFNKAFKWFQSSAQLGSSAAQFNLGVYYYNGSGIDRDFVAAYTWVKIASLNTADKTVRGDVLDDYKKTVAHIEPHLSAPEESKADRDVQACIDRNFVGCSPL